MAKAERVLDPDEMPFFYPLFIADIPLCSPESEVDLVRLLGKPEGTLREMKTRLKAKLKTAWEKA